MMAQDISLAQFVVETREKLGLAQLGLVKRSGLPTKVIEDIEAGVELFLSAGIRQKLARGLKLMPKEIKPYEKHEIIDLGADAKYICDIKRLILDGEQDNLKCPICQADLVVRVVTMYDLEDNAVKNAKAHCVKCVFQIK